MLGGKPFSFFRKDGRIGMWYDGQVLAAKYDEVIHYHCCGPAAYNVQSSPDAVWFFARRDDLWYFIELKR